jgi:hypothetical protein
MKAEVPPKDLLKDVSSSFKKSGLAWWSGSSGTVPA